MQLINEAIVFRIDHCIAAQETLQINGAIGTI